MKLNLSWEKDLRKEEIGLGKQKIGILISPKLIKGTLKVPIWSSSYKNDALKISSF